MKICSLGIMKRININGCDTLVEIDLDENDDSILSASFTVEDEDIKIDDLDNFMQIIITESLRITSIVTHSILKEHAIKLHINTHDYKWDNIVKQLLSQNGIKFKYLNGEFIIDVPIHKPVTKTNINWMSVVIIVEGIEIELGAYSTSNVSAEISFCRNDADDPFDELIGFKNPVKAMREIINSLVSWSKLFNSHVNFRGDDKRMRIYKKMLEKHNIQYVEYHDNEHDHECIVF